ncbi:hypothetical protein RN607_03010 [Demequina capsici]|uniref:Leucine rich repeat variant n=1 Tax=Demequina capsici TaxID=3075620 RepID=A0AA96JAU4_9MICO|nr:MULTISPECIES: hypothetical protein [unclassified Demequina]WNM25081.1 hypothetical protein RN606_02740 [Demequina sp. OYTSA14]WNM27987.1 hypothetical protein RN607_03010 [Demequina sp. PMTSA13]
MFSDGYTQETALARVRQMLDDGVSDAELSRLSVHEEALVRAAVAAHPGTSVLALLRLASDEATTVRAGVARNPRPDMPEDIHEQLAQDKRVEVRMALAGNPSLGREVLGKLSRSRDKDVALVARRRIAAEGGARGMLARLSMPRG